MEKDPSSPSQVDSSQSSPSGPLGPAILSRETRARFSLLAGSLLIGLFMAEGLLRTLVPEHEQGSYLHEPGLRLVFEPEPSLLPGVEGQARFLVNSKGIRGDEIGREVDFQILAVGGSTTECSYLDQDEAWPSLLQAKLNDRQKDHRVWVGNYGKMGISAREHRFQFPVFLDQLPDLNWVVWLVGVNDVLLRLAMDSGYDPYYPEKPEGRKNLIDRSFGYVRRPSRETGLVANLRLVRLLRKFVPETPSSLDVTLGEVHIEDAGGTVYQDRRRYRREAPETVAELPDLVPALEEYERNLEAALEVAQERDVGVILLTQPVLWDPDLPEHLRSLLWTGGIHSIAGEGLRYYSVGALSAAMDLYNEVLRKVAVRRHLPLIDLATTLPKDTTVFYDDCHFNENGSRVVAEILAERLLQLPPLAGS